VHSGFAVRRQRPHLFKKSTGSTAQLALYIQTYREETGMTVEQQRVIGAEQRTTQERNRQLPAIRGYGIQGFGHHPRFSYPHSASGGCFQCQQRVYCPSPLSSRLADQGSYLAAHGSSLAAPDYRLLGDAPREDVWKVKAPGPCRMRLRLQGVNMRKMWCSGLSAGMSQQEVMKAIA
jgi:hypothetical protein